MADTAAQYSVVEMSSPTRYVVIITASGAATQAMRLSAICQRVIAVLGRRGTPRGPSPASTGRATRSLWDSDSAAACWAAATAVTLGRSDRSAQPTPTCNRTVVPSGLARSLAATVRAAACSTWRTPRGSASGRSTVTEKASAVTVPASPTDSATRPAAAAVSSGTAPSASSPTGVSGEWARAARTTRTPTAAVGRRDQVGSGADRPPTGPPATGGPRSVPLSPTVTVDDISWDSHRTRSGGRPWAVPVRDR